MITKAHSKRTLILEHKAEELKLVLINTKSIVVIKKANMTKEGNAQLMASSSNSSQTPQHKHPMLRRLNIAHAHKATRKDLSSSI